MRNAESQRSDAFSTFHARCKDEGGGRSVDQNIGIGTFCSIDFSCKFQFRKFHKFCERKFNSIVKNFTKLIKLSKLLLLLSSDTAYQAQGCSVVPHVVESTDETIM